LSVNGKPDSMVIGLAFLGEVWNGPKALSVAQRQSRLHLVGGRERQPSALLIVGMTSNPWGGHTS
jgi:hypothetical protein